MKNDPSYAPRLMTLTIEREDMDLFVGATNREYRNMVVLQTMATRSTLLAETLALASGAAALQFQYLDTVRRVTVMGGLLLACHG